MMNCVSRRRGCLPRHRSPAPGCRYWCCGHGAGSCCWSHRFRSGCRRGTCGECRRERSSAGRPVRRHRLRLRPTGSRYIARITPSISSMARPSGSDLDQLGDEVGVWAVGPDMQNHADLAGDRQIRVERLASIDQAVIWQRLSRALVARAGVDQHVAPAETGDRVARIVAIGARSHRLGIAARLPSPHK